MSATHRIGLLLLVGFVFVLGNTFAGAQGEKAKPAGQKWEYKTLTQTEFTKAGGLEQLGDEGWELAAVEPERTEPNSVADFKFGGLVRNTLKQTRTYYFKRPKQ